MSSNIVSVLNGHLGSGRWQIKEEDGIHYLSHPQPFSRRAEFRIGPDQVEGLSVEQDMGTKLIVKIRFKEDSYCRAQILPETLPLLQKLVDDDRTVPLAKNQQQQWILIIGILILIGLVIELFK